MFLQEKTFDNFDTWDLKFSNNYNAVLMMLCKKFSLC